MVEVECGGFVFTSNFESGNLARVEQVQLPPKPPPLQGQNVGSSDVPDYEFNIWTNPDCAGTEFENSSRSWFYFGIRGGTPFALVKLNLVNLNRQVKMYSQGMAPVFRILPGRGLWDRIRDKPTYTVSSVKIRNLQIEDNVFTLSFRYRTLENVRATTYFAFTFPYSYQDLMSSLKNFDKRFKSCPPPEKYFPGHSPGVNSDDIYYHRELACYSLEGRRLDLITISSHHGITREREPRLKNLFPDLDTPRPFIFVGKKVIFVSARVHPGEVPSSYVLNGLLESLLNREDLTSILLRRMYVFKIIPMLNPDGVAHGHFRTDTRGVNLNRVYLNPSLTLHPTIYAARAIIKYAHFGREVDNDTQLPSEVVGRGSVDSFPPASAVKESNLRCTSPQQSQIMNSHSSPNLPSLSQSSSNPPHEVNGSELVLETGETDSVDVKDIINMQCDTPLHTDEDMIHSNENTVSQGSSDPIEMDIEKDKIMTIDSEGDPLQLAKSTIRSDFLQEMVEYERLDEGIGSLRSQGGVEVHDNETKEISEEGCEAIPLGEDANLSTPGGETFGAEETRRRRDPKRKPLPSGCSKPLRLFIRPIIHNEDDQRSNDSQFTSCNANSTVGNCLSAFKPSLDPSKSGLFLYMDMHGHASKKGIFMYGNHFDEIEQLVECMLLPKLMSINSQNFHFTACNFTERNMYLRDRRDGMSREGCGRVSVMKMTGLVRSYTLECNYNTGRMVNLLPPCVRDSGRMSVNPAYAVPPKYTPLVFEDVGRALGVSILDLSNSNPCSRVPNSEYRSVNGIRDWLRSNCLSDNQLWTRMLHRPTRQQVMQSSSSQSVAGPSGLKHIHLTKSVLLARISTELKTLGEEYARKEHQRMQRTASCSQLDSLEGGSSLQPKENIGPGQYGSRTRRHGELASVQLKNSQSGILQQRSKTLSAANLTSSSRKKIKSSVSGSSGPLRPVAKVKAIRRPKAQVPAGQSGTSSGDSVSGVLDEAENAEPDVKSSPSAELCASPKRMKVSGKSGKLSRKRGTWTMKCSTVENTKTENSSEAVQLPWPTGRNVTPQVGTKKACGLGKLEKNTTSDPVKFQTTVLSKVRAVKSLSSQDPSAFGENLELKVDSTNSFVKVTDKMQSVQSSKDSKSTTVEIFKQSTCTSSARSWIRPKSSSQKAGKSDLSLPGPSSAEPCGFEVKGYISTATKVEPKFKTNVLRSLEKGSKSRLLCPVRRRSSNEGKRAWKSLDRKLPNAENSGPLALPSTSKTASGDVNCANHDL